MDVALVFLSGGGISGGPRKTLSKQIPLLRNHGAIDRIELFFPSQFRGMDIVDNSFRSWPSGDRMVGFRNLRSMVQDVTPDVVYIPNGAWFDTGGIPTVCTVRNTEPIVRPFGGNSLYQGLKNTMRARRARKACIASDRIIAVSGFVKDMLVTQWGVDAGKVGVVPHGVETAQKQVKPEAAAGIDAGEFWFSAGSLVPYRTLEDIICALSMRPVDETLLIAGKPVYSDRYKRNMCLLARRRGVADRVVWLGQLSADELSWCFDNAKAFIMSSVLEACPNVLLESLAAGAISISSTSPPMPEFYGDAAVFYEPGDYNGLARQMALVDGMEPRCRRQQSETAHRRAALFTWERNVDKIVKELRAAI